MKKVLISLFLGFVVFACFSQVPQELSKSYDAGIKALSSSSQLDDKLWLGFRIKEYPIVIYETKGRNALALNFNPPPSNFTKIEGSVISYGKIVESEPLYQGVRPYENRLASFIDSKELNSFPSAKIVESAFKVFEAYRGFNDKGVFNKGVYPVLNVENNVYSRCENECLIKAVSSETQEIKPLLSAFLSFREKRQLLLPKEISEVENSRELIDGLASFAGYFSLNDQEKKNYLSETVSRLQIYNKGGEKAEERFKDTGFVIIYLLDRMKFDFRGALEKSSRDSILPVLKFYTEGVSKDTSSFINIDTIRSEETAKVKEIEGQRSELLSSIQNADGVVIVVKIDEIVEKTKTKFNWSNRYEPDGIIYFSPSKMIFTKYFKLSGSPFFNFASSRPIVVELKNSLTVGFKKDEIPFITLDGKGIELAKDSPPITGKVDAKGAHFEMTIEKATLIWDYTKRTLTVEPIYQTN